MSAGEFSGGRSQQLPVKQLDVASSCRRRPGWESGRGGACGGECCVRLHGGGADGADLGVSWTSVRRRSACCAPPAWRRVLTVFAVLLPFLFVVLSSSANCSSATAEHNKSSGRPMTLLRWLRRAIVRNGDGYRASGSLTSALSAGVSLASGRVVGTWGSVPGGAARTMPYPQIAQTSEIRALLGSRLVWPVSATCSLREAGEH